MMREDGVTRVDLRIRSETLLELHSGLVQLWMYCVARETGACAGAATLHIDFVDVTQGVLDTLGRMFSKAGVAFVVGTDGGHGGHGGAAVAACGLGAYHTRVAQYTLAFALLPPPRTRCR